MACAVEVGIERLIDLEQVVLNVTIVREACMEVRPKRTSMLWLPTC